MLAREPSLWIILSQVVEAKKRSPYNLKPDCVKQDCEIGHELLVVYWV